MTFRDWLDTQPNGSYPQDLKIAEAIWDAATTAERERCAAIVELTEVDGGYSREGLEDGEGSVWCDDPQGTLASAAKRIRDGVPLPPSLDTPPAAG
jgi:hypothetical protein